MALNESLQIDGLELNPAPGVTSPYSLDNVEFPTPRKRYEWVQGADADGAALVRDPLFEQRTIAATVRVTDTTRDLVHDAIAAIEAKLEEAEQQANGLAVVWTPANSTESLTFYCLSGEIGDIPVTHESGYFANSVAVPVTLTCKPFGYGSTITGTPVTASTPLVTATLAGVPGDVPAEAKIIVTNNLSAPVRDAIWGLEQHDYNAGTPASLVLAASNLVTSGFAGTSGTTPSGAYLTNSIGAAAYSQVSALCGTGNQPHVGTFRVRARVQATGTAAVKVRLAWQNGDAPSSTNAWATLPASGAWCEIDLGLITITAAAAGSQRWTGRVEIIGTDATHPTVSLNYLALIPAGEGYGRARASVSPKTGVLVGYDDFASITAGAALNGRTPGVGAAWVTTGATTDFTGAFLGGSGSGTFAVQRATASDAAGGRVGVFGANMTDTEIHVTFRVTDLTTTPNAFNRAFGAVARYVDANNYLTARVTHGGGSPSTGLQFNLDDKNAGTYTSIRSWGPQLSLGNDVWYRISLTVYASGVIVATLSEDASGALLATLTAVSSRAATGGALASGKNGIYDSNADTTVVTRSYTNVSILTPAAEPVVAYASRTIEFRHDDVLRYDTAGTYAGRPPSYRGGRALVPPAGDDARTSRVVAATRPNDTDTTSDGGVTNSTTLQVDLTPRYVAVPH